MRSDPIPFLTTHHLSYTQADTDDNVNMAGPHEAPAAPTPRRDADGEIVIRNDEFCGGFMMTQFYRPKLMQAHHVRMESLTKARFLHVWPIIFPLYWDLKVEAAGANRTLFHCRIGARLPFLYFLASKLIRLQFWSQQHADEETPLFAHYASRWATRNDPDQPERFWL